MANPAGRDKITSRISCWNLVARRQVGQLRAAAVEEWIGTA
jgi:hypothetical protein